MSSELLREIVRLGEQRDKALTRAARLEDALRKLVDSCSTTHPDWGPDICQPDGNDMSRAVSVLVATDARQWLREQIAAELERLVNDCEEFTDPSDLGTFVVRSSRIEDRAAELRRKEGA